MDLICLCKSSSFSCRSLYEVSVSRFFILPRSSSPNLSSLIRRRPSLSEDPLLLGGESARSRLPRERGGAYSSSSSSSSSRRKLLETLPILDMVARLIRAPPVCAETALPLDSRGSALFPPQNYVVTRRMRTEFTRAARAPLRGRRADSPDVVHWRRPEVRARWTGAPSAVSRAGVLGPGRILELVDRCHPCYFFRAVRSRDRHNGSFRQAFLGSRKRGSRVADRRDSRRLGKKGKKPTTKVRNTARPVLRR